MQADPVEPDLKPMLARLLDGEMLNADEAEAAFSLIMGGGVEPAQLAAFLALLQQRSPTVEELVGAARVMRANVRPVPVPDELRPRLIDTCGTGGTRKTFNVSTAAAIVAAGAGAVVAKHGNRSRTGRGSAEVLLGLGVNIDAEPEVQARCLEEAGLCFSFAVHHHPATKHAMPVRRALGFATIFNLLGPLTNPASASRQVLGVYAPHLVDLMAQALARLGARRAIVLHSEDGLDEISPAAVTSTCELHQGAIQPKAIDPREFGLAPASLEEIAAVDLDAAVALMREILDGRPGPARTMVLLNAAAALVVADVASDLHEGIHRAAESIDSGAAKSRLARLAAASHG